MYIYRTKAVKLMKEIKELWAENIFLRRKKGKKGTYY